MRLKYQLRGLGIGIIIAAALLMGSSDDGEVSAKSSAGTQDIVADAGEKENTYEEISEKEEAVTIQEEAVAEPESVAETQPMEETQEQTEAVTAEEETSQAEPERVTEEVSEEFSTESVAEEPAVSTEGMVIIKIVGGDDSGTVARKLQTAGLVENAKEYDAYLMQHGYDKKIAVGTAEIPIGSSWQEIAEKISGKK